MTSDQAIDKRAASMLWARANLGAALEKAAVDLYRERNPLSRAPRAIVLARNGGSRKSERCVLCGSEGPTWCAKWRKTHAASRFAAHHTLVCPAVYLANEGI